MSKWEKVALKHIGEIVTGNTPSTKIDDYYNSNDIPFYKPNDISNTEVSKLNIATSYISETARSCARIIPCNSILVTCIGIIGKTAITTTECSCNQQINAIIPYKDLANSLYLAYAIMSKKTYMQDTANAPIVPIINKTKFASIEIPLPPLKEQHKIASILDTVSEALKLRKQQLNELNLLVKSKFIDMFGDPIKNPKNLKLGIIRDICSEVKYGTSKPATNGGKYPYLRMNNITYDGHLDLSNLKYIDISESEVEKYLVKNGDVLFNRTNSKELVGKTCVFNLNKPMIIAGYLIRIRVNSNVLPIYLSCVLNSDYGKTTLLGMCKSIIGQANINAQELQNIKILIPPIELQNKFASFVEHVDKLKSEVQKSIDQLQTLFDSLMQQYFE